MQPVIPTPLKYTRMQQTTGILSANCHHTQNAENSWSFPKMLRISWGIQICMQNITFFLTPEAAGPGPLRG